MSKRYRLVGFTVLAVGAIALIGGVWTHHDTSARYTDLKSDVLYDRKGTIIQVHPNQKGHYAIPTNPLPEGLESLLLAKEDQWFYYHPGINPISLGQAVVATLRGEARGGSTITQQLAKQLLGNELDRSLTNKLQESLYAIGLELGFSKAEILAMYSNAVYFGNQIQGFESASRAYFDQPLADTSLNQQLSLLATMSYPSTRNPWESEHPAFARALSAQLLPAHRHELPVITDSYRFTTPTAFEFQASAVACSGHCVSTVDATITEDLRAIISRQVAETAARGGRHAAAVVLDAHSGDILALIGSPNPASERSGNQINLALTPRPIGSTIKPFIYLQGFAAGLRPYTLIEDREYKYPIASGFHLYPKNYDGQYRGEVTLHKALSASLNVPTVKTLEYVGLDSFYAFLREDLEFVSVAPLESYEYGIALGGLETDLLTLSTYFTVFPTLGTVSPPRLMQDATAYDLPVHTTLTAPTTISNPQYLSLINVILADRLRGVEQFGLVNNLTLPIDNYGVKTGTSRDYHDSWVVGYTPDLVVGVWLGNAENEPLQQISGQSGAGAIWNEIMSYLITTEYYTDRPFPQADIMQFSIDGSLEWGLPEDTIAEHRDRLTEEYLITGLHHEDVFSFTDTSAIPLQATEPVTWRSNGEFIGQGSDIRYRPEAPGRYEISAEAPDGHREIVHISLIRPE